MRPNTRPPKASLEATARWLDRVNADAAASLREGLEETLTVVRLGVPRALRRALATTNPIESSLSVTRRVTARVTRWRDGDMRRASRVRPGCCEPRSSCRRRSPVAAGSPRTACVCSRRSMRFRESNDAGRPQRVVINNEEWDEHGRPSGMGRCSAWGT